MCILTFGLAGLSWEDMRKQELHGWAILLLGISGMAVSLDLQFRAAIFNMAVSLLGGCWKNPVCFWDYCRGYLCLYWPGVQEKVLDMGMVW